MFVEMFVDTRTSVYHLIMFASEMLQLKTEPVEWGHKNGSTDDPIRLFCYWPVSIYSQKQAEDVPQKKRPKFPRLYWGLCKHFLEEEGNSDRSCLLCCCFQTKPIFDIG